MGKMDIMTKEYMSDNKRFVDLFNYFLYGGREILLVEELEERDPEEILISMEKSEGNGEDSSKGSGSKSSYTKRERDLLRSAVVRVTALEASMRC